MAGPKVVQDAFSGGVWRSAARDGLGGKSQAVLWDARDFILGRLGVPLGKRGGWQYQGGVCESTLTPTVPSYIHAMSNDPFNGGNFMRAQDKDGKFWIAHASEDFATWHKEMDYNNHSVEYNQDGASKQNGIFIGDGLYFPSSDGTKLGSNHNELYGQDMQIAAGAGDEPIYLATHLNRMWGLDTHENLWAGSPSLSLPWDEDGKYGLQQPGRGLISLGQEMLVFFDGETRLVRGTIPAGYGVTQDNIRIDKFSGDIGLIDAFSIIRWNTQAIWVDHNGVWVTDGTNYPLDLAWAGNAQDLFYEFIASYVNPATTRVACGIYSNLLVVSMTDLSDHEHIDTLVCDLNRRIWSRWQNTPFTCFVRGSLDTSETWAGVGSEVGRIAKLSTVLSPSSATALDGNDEPVVPSLQTAFYRFSPADARIIAAWLGYEMDTDGINEVQTITTAASSGTGTIAGQSVAWNANAATVQTALDTALGTGVVVVTGVAGAWVVTWVAEGSQTALAVVQGTLNAVIVNTETAAGYDAPELKVEYATDPRAEPTFGSYAGTPYFLPAHDIHGAADDGYHWKPVPIRDQGPGIVIKVTQTGPSGTTSIFSVGVEAIPFPSHSQR